MAKLTKVLVLLSMVFVLIGPTSIAISERFSSPASATISEKFSSPAAQISYTQSGQLDTQPAIHNVVESLLANPTQIIAQYRSSGCSVGCSTGCSGGCSVGCSVGCRLH